MKFIEKVLMASEDVKSYLVSGVCEDKELADGSLVKIGDLVDHAVYAGLKDMNTRAIEPYAGEGRVGVVDYVGVTEADVIGVSYRVGSKVLGLPVPAGVSTRVRTLKLGDEFYLADGNFESTPTVGQYAVAGSDGMWAPAAAEATDKLCVKIEEVKNKVVGAVNDGKKYFCTVIHE